MTCVVPNCNGMVRTMSISKLCLQCYGNWTSHKEKGWDNWLILRATQRLMPEKFVNSQYDKIPLEDRVITRKGGVHVNGTHICRGCDRDRFIMNPTYHLCSTCTGRIQYFGETCGVCELIHESKIIMDWNRQFGILNCGNCKSKLRKYRITPDKLKEYLALVNCPLCDCILTDGQSPTGRCIDHDHNCCSYEKSHSGHARTCGKCVRGVICGHCNKAEGYTPRDVIAWAIKVDAWRNGSLKQKVTVQDKYGAN